MPTFTLTDARCRAAKPGDKLKKLFDGGGLHLAITPTGAKTWRVAYRLNGKPQTKTLGPFPAVSLADARGKLADLKATLRTGADPMAERKAKRQTLTVKEACTAFWDGRADVSEGYRANATRAMEMHIHPTLGGKPIASVSRDDVLTALNVMDAKGLHDYVRKCRMWLGQVFDWAVERGEASINPCASINPKKAFGKSEVEHFAALSPGEVPEFLARLNLEAELQSVLACRLLALTWVRTKELRMMKWANIEGDTWRIPGAIMKKKNEHLVPLSKQALAILAKLKARASGSDYVFPSDRRTDRPMSENAVLYLIHRIGYQGRMTGHGWRSTASTWANEAGYKADAVERQLAHVPGDKTRAAYMRAEFLPERRAMLQDWADWLDKVDPSRPKG